MVSGKVRRGQTIPDNDALVQVIKMRPEILQQMLQTVLNIIMFEDCRNQWSMSRPLLGLILLNEDYFSQLRDQLISSQPPQSSWWRLSFVKFIRLVNSGDGDIEQFQKNRGQIAYCIQFLLAVSRRSACPQVPHSYRHLVTLCSSYMTWL